MERLTSEQIRLLEELRELRDSGILTVDEFEVQVAKVLGRPLVVEPLPVDEELSAPEDTPVAELLEYEFDEPNVSDEDELLVEENRVVEPLPISDTSASSVVESEPQQNILSRRKVLIGTAVGLIFVVVIGLVTLVGGGKSDSTSSQIVDSTTTVTQSTIAATTQAPTTSMTTTTEVIPTTTYEVLECPYTRVIEAIDGKIVTPEGITLSVFDQPLSWYKKSDGDVFGITADSRWVFQLLNSTNFRLRIDVVGDLIVDGFPYRFNLNSNRSNLRANGFENSVGQLTDVEIEIPPIDSAYIELTQATIEYRCP